MEVSLLLIILSFGLPLTLSQAAAAAVMASLSQDARSLLHFKSCISHDPSNLLSNWTPFTYHCHWYGVHCHPVSGKVIAIHISGTRIAGLLSPSIANLTHLRSLSLPHNLFSGQIPSALGLIRPLQTLELQGNNFSGHIPHPITSLSSLRLLNLSHNTLSGPILDGLVGFGRLTAIDLSDNLLSGAIKVHKCEFLNHLKLSNNYLVGNIPADIGKCSNLRTLLLDGNIFEGRIPPEIGQIPQLQILDISRNSLVDRIPRALANCRKLSVIVLTNLIDFRSDRSSEEVNAVEGGIPYEVLLLPNLQIFWAPRANLGGRLPGEWSNLCSLRMLNLGQNYFTGVLPQSMSLCKKLTFLDLSSNGLQGHFPWQLPVPCMVYFNISRNSLSGSLPRFWNTSCDDDISNMISYEQDPNFLNEEDVQRAYTNIPPLWVSHTNTAFGSSLDEHVLVIHDFSWNNLRGSLPSFSIGNRFFVAKNSYKLFANNNQFNGSLPDKLFLDCNDLQSFSVNLSANQIYGALYPDLFLHCSQLTDFEAANNNICGSIPAEIGSWKALQRLDLSNNKLSGSLPDELAQLKGLIWISLRENNLTGEISSDLGRLTSLVVLDLSQNALTGSIPGSLVNATNLEVILLDHNRFSGEIPASFSALSNLLKLDLSFNNFSGRIPYLQIANHCDSFKGNRFLNSCKDHSAPPTGLPLPPEVQQRRNPRKLKKSFLIAMATCASLLFFVLAVIVVVLILGRKKLRRITSPRRKVVVTFSNGPTELNYDNVVGATGNFSIRNLIGTGGFGSTYKAEMVPGFVVAVKKLSIGIGRFQGIQQFDAEIRTLGRIRHKNLVTLLGYHVGEDEMFLVYNFLSGGNLETFIHERSGKNLGWPVIHKIAVDIAQALSFLHYSCVPRIVHRDIKPSNILLDDELNAYLSDFGLARLLEVFETHATTDVAGTFGYVAPEYATTCRVSSKADVYSFGVVLLELVSGKKSLDPSFSEYENGFNIAAWAKLLIEEGRLSELFSPELWEAGPRENLLGMSRLASDCTADSLSVRPSMKQVLEKLKQLNS